MNMIEIINSKRVEWEGEMSECIKHIIKCSCVCVV